MHAGAGAIPSRYFKGKDTAILILSRRISEKIVIDSTPPVTLTVIDIRHGVVRLGFDTERTVSILRSELLDREPATD